jgi:hypothetical protein
MIKLLTIAVLTCCVLGGGALAQSQAPAESAPTSQTPPPDSKYLPPDLKYEGRSKQTSPSNFPGEPSEKGYGTGAPENPHE